MLTHAVDECGIELFGEQWVWHVPQELFQKSRHVMDAVLLIQLDL